MEAGRRINSLRRAVDDLPVPAGDLLSEEKTALSPDTGVLTVIAEAQAPASHSVEVRWSARGGLILSSSQHPIAAIDLDDGEYTFILTLDGVEYELNVKAYNGSIREDPGLLSAPAPGPALIPRRSSWAPTGPDHRRRGHAPQG